jgi:PTS system mannose-specific IID component
VSVPRPTLARCFWRGLFLQAAWNRRGMQNLGFAFAIDPALRALYPEPGRRAEALARHLEFFNCHPYTAAAILGGAIHHEERVAAGVEPAAAPAAYKATLQGPLAAVGDGFFWTALRPFFGALSAAGALLFGWPALVVTLAAYNAIHLAIRVGLFRAGYRGGDAVVASVARLSLPLVAERLRVAGAALCGLCATVLALRAHGLPRMGAATTAALAAAAGYAVLGRGLRVLPATYAAIMLGAGAGLIASRLYGGP